MKWLLILEKMASSRSMIQVCMDIRNRDETFQYYLKGDDIVIPTDSKDKAHKIGSWMHNKTEDKPYYRVEREKQK